MNRKDLGKTTFCPAHWRDRTNQLAIIVAAALLAHEAWAAKTKTAPVPSTQTNRVAMTTTSVSATNGFNLELTRSVYKPDKGRDPFLKPGATATGSGGIKTVTAGQLVFRLQAILWSPTNPSAVVNDQFLDLNKTAVFHTTSGDVEVKAVEIGREQAVLEVAGQRLELKLNPEQPSGKPPE